ncbi:Uncharacterized protein conserved in bacteria [Chryseobacterium taklimakanense]|uniref:Uncharacterized protein conserved in bacteria n=1 Tax=Chryseobacterium taklimakanense TaxID=536441 RepID=A0A239X7A5_9FLAO|nr:AAA family ATPase [Chryseobacterium taklimakanense]SNV42083.1 Uncharacterized protein conserved in bacteria [Chryseobacterium taklimakanense]
MGKTLREIAQDLKDANKKVQLIYAFNGTGKTRLSREFKELISPKSSETEDEKVKVLYYNAFTEDLFYWDNDLQYDSDRKLKIQPNNYTNWVLVDQGKEASITTHFQRYTSAKLTPKFNEAYSIKDAAEKDIIIPAFSEVHFSFERGNDEAPENIKISKGEESCFIWSVFYSLLEETIDVLNIPEKSDRATDVFNDLKYVFIDDPVSSLDETHLIELAVNIAELIKWSQSEIKFIITTHNPLFYNVLFNEFNNAEPKYNYKPKHSSKYILEKLEDGTYYLKNQNNDSPFSYHLFLLSELEKLITTPENIQKYHFNFLRNILEKMSTFLGYNKWKELLPAESQEAYYNRIINLSSHSKFSGEETTVINDNDKRVLIYLVKQIKTNYRFKDHKNNTTEEENVTV